MMADLNYVIRCETCKGKIGIIVGSTDDAYEPGITLGSLICNGDGSHTIKALQENEALFTVHAEEQDF
jgi:hypothetical protein